MKNNIKKLRTALELSQEELVNLCQVSRQTINVIENNKYDPSLQLAFDMAFILNTTVDKLFIPAPQ